MRQSLTEAALSAGCHGWPATGRRTAGIAGPVVLVLAVVSAPTGEASVGGGFGSRRSGDAAESITRVALTERACARTNAGARPAGCLQEEGKPMDGTNRRLVALLFVPLSGTACSFTKSPDTK